jgi:hypothetical protein
MKMRFKPDPNSLLNKYLGPDKEKCETNLRLDRHQIKPQDSLPQRISLIGVGNMIGEEDASQLRNYTVSCQCIS